MAHLFRVDFITNHVSGLVESGRVVVVAESHEEAHHAVAAHLNLPESRTRFTASKLKPAFYCIGTEQSYPTVKVTRRDSEAPYDPPIRKMQKYRVQVEVSNVAGRSEQQVLRKVGEELQARGARTAPRHNLEMSVHCSTQASAPRAHGAMERIELYRPATKPMQGGRTQGR